MDKVKVFKKETNNIIYNMNSGNKINNKDIMLQFKDFKGKSNFNCKVDPMNVEDKDILELILLPNTLCDKYYFEWTDYQSKVKPYYDIDIFFNEGESWENHIEGFKNRYIKLFEKYFPDGEIAIASSHGEKIKVETVKGVKKEKKGNAISFHFIINGYETTIPQLKKFNEMIKIYEQDPNIDKGVYRNGGNMRCLYSNKPNDNRTFVPDNFEKEPFKHLIQSCEWSNSDFKPIPAKASPPVSPISSDNEEEVVEVKKENPVNIVLDEKSDEEVMEFKPKTIQKKKVDYNELQKIMEAISIDKFSSDYDTWMRVGLALSNITEGNSIGKTLFQDFSETYDRIADGSSKRDVKYKWKNFKDTAENHDNKLGMTYLRSLYNKIEKKEENVSFQSIFYEEIDKGKSFDEAKDKILNKMNERLIYVRETGEFIHLGTKLTIKEDGEKLESPCWYLKKKMTTADDFIKENFSYTMELPNGKTTKISVEPFKMWMSWMGRKEVRAIGFDPTDKENKDIFNIWNGYDISEEIAEKFDEVEAQPILNHILECWCNGDEQSFEYVMDYFAHIIQKPWKKSGVVLALRSKQGGGKGVIISKLGEIIGDNHFCQNSNANYLFGDFNGQLEGKILVNLDEAFWGGDKKMEGMMKNKITERNQTINKKNKEAYMVSDYANYIISTNNDWFAGTTEDDRRYYCLELNNKHSGRMTKEKEEYFNPIVQAPAGAFAKILYGRDLTHFNPRIFKKTKLLQEQVERNHNPVKVWWHKVLQDGGWDGKNGFGDKNFNYWNKLDEDNAGDKIKNKKTGEEIVGYFKDYIYERYKMTETEKRGFNSVSAFYRELKQNCLGDLYKEIRPKNKDKDYKAERPAFLVLPSLEEARAKWNELQEYDYEWFDEDDEWEC
jgi:hypothetical protein